MDFGLGDSWLVSVRDQDEFNIAIEAGVGILDLKEPRNGALAPCSASLWQWVASCWENAIPYSERDATSNLPPLSAALGEQDEAKRVVADLPSAFRYAKVGPSGCGSQKQLLSMWESIQRQLAEGIELVAVAYADWEQAECLKPNTIFSLAAEFGLDRCLIDTFTKAGDSSVVLLGPAMLRDLQQIAGENSLWWALAGSINEDDVLRLDQDSIYPSCIGVRGAVCSEGRESSLCPKKLGSWKEMLQGRLRRLGNQSVFG
jgi:uncharacterized protein (UPF0264 family)